jgi:glycerophosphoryl diester phosphodiesterase
MAADPQKILVHGHRGARAASPENTLPAFEYAIAQGVDVLELDLAVTRDNALVVSHDPEMNAVHCEPPPGSGDKPERIIRNMTLAEVKRWDCGSKGNPEFPNQKKIPGTRVPTLYEVFEATKNAKVEYNIETKIFRDKPQLTPSPAEFARLVFDAVRRARLDSRVIVQSFDNRTLIEMKRLAPGIRLSMLTPSSPMDALKNWVTACREAGAGIVSPNHLTVTAGRVQEARAAGLQIVPWTANKPADWERLVEAKVDAIITDDPAALIAWLKARGLR